MLSDSHFPNGATRLHKILPSIIYEGVFERYTKLDLTFLGDKPLPIVGLEARLEQYYETTSTYGIRSLEGVKY
ncbi:hypothetical protein BDV23DRAFT_150655 [Aspergillus alliaceus]|uniref:Uncharacterized protein n=1 Tax=Petromyces alliaceus TaxID=209559 RepID=A0A5N7CFC3_PETAA|nr:hypothetical protein BDV23DRAFT_150655 [Aspergillus alliaceus]